jgi:hypothetical protein
MEHSPRRTGTPPPPSPRRPELGHHVIDAEEGHHQHHHQQRKQKQQRPPPLPDSPGRSGTTINTTMSTSSGSSRGRLGGAAASATGKGKSPRGLLTFEQAEACFAAERQALLKDLAALQRVVEQKDGERERLVRKAEEAERAYKARLDRALEGGFTNSSTSTSTSRRRIAALEEELAVLRASVEEAARRHRSQREAETGPLKARVAELEHWVEATGSERAAMVALLRNGSEQCRAVLLASSENDDHHHHHHHNHHHHHAATAPVSPCSTASSPGRRTRRLHLERVRALQGEFAAMLARLEQIPSFATAVPISPRPFHHHHHTTGATGGSSYCSISARGAGSSPRPYHTKQQLAYSGGGCERKEEGGGMEGEAHAAGQKDLADARAEISRLRRQLEAAKAQAKEAKEDADRQRRARSLSPRRSPRPATAAWSPRRKAHQGQEEEAVAEKWAAVVAENRRVQDHLEALLQQGQQQQHGRREDDGPFPEVEALLGQGASLFYELATRLQEQEDGESGGGGGGGGGGQGAQLLVQDYGRGLAHVRRLLVGVERRLSGQAGAWALVAAFFREACGVAALPAVGGREEELRRVLAACKRDVLTAKERAAAAAAATAAATAAPAPPSSPRSCPSPGRTAAATTSSTTTSSIGGVRRGGPAVHHNPEAERARGEELEGLRLLQRAVEAVLHTQAARHTGAGGGAGGGGGGVPALAPMSPEALALLLRERWVALGEVAGEARRLKQEKQALAQEAEALKGRVRTLQDQQREREQEGKKGKGEAAAAKAASAVLRDALRALLGEVSDEAAPSAQEPPERLIAAVGRGLAELKGALVQMAPPGPAATGMGEDGQGGRRLIDLLDAYLRRSRAHAKRLQRELQSARAAEATAAAALAATDMSPAAAARRLADVEAAVLEALELLGQPPVLSRGRVGGSGGAMTVGVDLAESLRRAVGAVKGEGKAKDGEVERVKREAQVGRRVLEAERGELRAEVVLIRRVLTAYEGALHEALAGAEELVEVDGFALSSSMEDAVRGEEEEAGAGVEAGKEVEEERQQHALAQRLRRHVQALKRLAEQRAADVRAVEQAAAAERAGLLEAQAAIEERASLYWRLARSLRDAARTVLGLPGGEGSEQGGMEVEEVKALCIRLLQFGARARGQAGERAEAAGRWGERLAERERECQLLREKLRCVVGALCGL